MKLKLLPPPIAIEGFIVSMVWHQRNTNNSAHQWLFPTIKPRKGNPVVTESTTNST